MLGSIAFIGAGNMTRSLIKGLLVKGGAPNRIVVSNRSKDKLVQLSTELGTRAASNQEIAETAEVIVLSVKPHCIESVCTDIAPIIMLRKKKPLCISLASAITIQNITHWIGKKDLGVVRAMTNISISVGMGTTAMFSSAILSLEEKKWTETLFNSVGTSFWVPHEDILDTLTPLIGSGPAYLYLVVEALGKAAVDHGIPEPEALTLALDVLTGACALAQQSTRSVEALRSSVTTPHGITAAALKPFLEGAHVFGLFHDSFKQALIRCKEIEASSGSTPDRKL